MTSDYLQCPGISAGIEGKKANISDSRRRGQSQTTFVLLSYAQPTMGRPVREHDKSCYEHNRGCSVRTRSPSCKALTDSARLTSEKPQPDDRGASVLADNVVRPDVI